MKFVRDLEQLRSQRLLARSALKKVGRLPFKPTSSAKWTDLKRTKNGSIVVQIEHDDAKGVTPEMLKWWFEHLSCTTKWNGVDFSGPEITLYHLWHHRDHVAVTPLTNAPDGTRNTGFREGADSQIHERFNEFHDHIYFTMHTTKLDDKEFTFQIMVGGVPVGHIKHTYQAVEEGCAFYAETRIGMEIPVIGWLLNHLLLPFFYTKKSGENWIRHNIEETGRTQDILPILYGNQDKVYYSEDMLRF